MTTTEETESDEAPDTETDSSSQTFHGNITAGDSYGDNYNTWLSPQTGEPDPDPVHGPMFQRLVDEADRLFCPPGSFAKAQSLVRNHPVVLLCGSGTGRSIAGIRLLRDAKFTEVQRLDPERSPEDLTGKWIVEGQGYLWRDLSKTWQNNFSSADLEQLTDLMRRQGAKLIIAAEDAQSLPVSVRKVAVQLTPPLPVEILDAHLDAGGLEPEQRQETVDWLRSRTDLLEPGIPRRLVQIAEHLRRTYPVRDLGQLREEIQEVDDEEIREWFEEEQDLRVRSLCVATAFLESSPYAMIAEAAQRLETTLRNPENEDIFPYTPPDLFAATRKQMLHRAGASIESASGAEDGPDQVRFARPGWGLQFLRYTWREYDRLQPILRHWIAEIPEPATHTVERFGQVLAQTSLLDWMGWVRSWAADESFARKSMAAMAVNGRLDEPGFSVIAKRILSEWVTSGTMALRQTAAVAFQGRIGRELPRFSLAKLRLLTEKPDAILRRQVVSAVGSLLEEPSNRAMVLTALVNWTSADTKSVKGIAVECAIDALGFGWRRSSETVRKTALDQRDPEPVRSLTARLLRDSQHRPVVIQGLRSWARYATTDPEQSDSLDRLLRALLTSPDADFVGRLGFFLRKDMFENGAGAAPLADALRRALNGDSDGR